MEMLFLQKPDFFNFCISTYLFISVFISICEFILNISV